jgi:formate hydrogenlyase subunit 3/multisubunit Na+/H+ antiporter MnhD subunit
MKRASSDQLPLAPPIQGLGLLLIFLGIFFVILSLAAGGEGYFILFPFPFIIGGRLDGFGSLAVILTIVLLTLLALFFLRRPRIDLN